MSNQYVRELLLGEDELANQAADAKNMETRDQNARVLTALAPTILTAQDNITEPLTRDNQLLLLAGQFPGATLKAPATTLRGQPGCQFTGPLNLQAAASVEGIWFTGKTAAALVQVAASANPVFFRGCRFTKQQGVGGDYVTMQAGAKAVFCDCWFDGIQIGGNPINNLGIAADCGVVGGSNQTGQTHVAVTNVFELS